MHLTILFIFLFLTAANATFQHPFRYDAPFASTNDDKQKPSNSYQFKWPIRKIAIIGAGAGGLVTYREFARMGYEVRIFERDSVPGGNWHYTDEVPLNAPVPNLDLSEADFQPHLPPENVALPYEESFVGLEPSAVSEARRAHRAPKPIWHSLTSTAPKLRELPWPDHTPLTLTQNHLQRYVRTFASLHEINSNDNNPNTSYNTRVERVDKRYDANGKEAGWSLTLRKFIETGPNSYKIQWWTEEFDAIIVASGRFSAPNLPRIPGLTQWAQLHPHLISHSRQYRRPEEFTNQTVLVVGGSVSGTEIAEDLSAKAKKVFLSVRPHEGQWVVAVIFCSMINLSIRLLPKNVSIVPEIKFFHPLPIRPTDENFGIQLGEIELINGTLLRGFDRIIFATGFRYAFPFLPQYHNASLRSNETIPAGSGRPQPLITDGTHIRSLHLDTFYIEEPTIGFINMNLGIESFMYSEFAASAIAKVWAGEAKLPSTQEMWDQHWQRVIDAGGAYGGQFMYLGSAKEAALVRYIIGWLNEDAVKYGGHQVSRTSLDIR
ncbi:hypothetical protein F5050DRAFT_1568782 [Lentinula boryana]|uniref:FAD/NAD(P)-binding domain-containing protein n=1 Tax=Lentinula boryana TaxID=40481 RepID=A0ABQ8QGW4_9AGAR|nr:hypothetical protein F5050DRAFT_1568782 [Lentinula boryana]